MEHRRIPDAENPRYFNDYLFRMKVDGTLLDPLRQFTSDKEYVKTYVRSVVGEKYVIETHEILKTPAEVDAFVPEHLPCVVKPTHSGGRVKIYHDSPPLPDKAVMKEWLTHSFYRITREPSYRHLVPRIIVEEFFSKDGRTPPPDYKVFCFYGMPRFIEVVSNRLSDLTVDVYDVTWKRLPLKFSPPTSPAEENPQPPELEEMLDVAERLARGFSFVRVDLYALDGEVRVGELTHCPANGGIKMFPPSAERALAQLFHPAPVPDLVELLRQAEKEN